MTAIDVYLVGAVLLTLGGLPWDNTQVGGTHLDENRLIIGEQLNSYYLTFQ